MAVLASGAAASAARNAPIASGHCPSRALSPAGKQSREVDVWPRSSWAGRMISPRKRSASSLLAVVERKVGRRSIASARIAGGAPALVNARIARRASACPHRSASSFQNSISSTNARASAIRGSPGNRFWSRAAASSMATGSRAPSHSASAASCHARSVSEACAGCQQRRSPVDQLERAHPLPVERGPRRLDRDQRGNGPAALAPFRTVRLDPGSRVALERGQDDAQIAGGRACKGVAHSAWTSPASSYSSRSAAET